MSFRLKTILGVAIIEAILLTVLIISGLELLRTSNQAELEKRAGSLVHLFATSAKDAVLSTDLATLDELTAELADTPGVVYVRIRGRDGRRLSAAGVPEALSRPFAVDRRAREVDDKVYDVFEDVEEGGRAFGRIELGLSTRGLDQMLREAKGNALGIAATELLLSALFSLALGTYLTRQLRGLADAAREVAAGNLGVQVPVKGRDELSETAAAFNSMSERVEAARAALEARVEERTQELTQANRDLGEALASARQTEEHRQLLAAALEQAGEAVFITDRDGRIEYANPAFCTMTGYSVKEALNHTPRILKSGRHSPRFYASLWRVVLRGEPFHAVFSNCRKDGSLYFEEKTIAPIRNQDGVITHFASTGRDVTERIEHEQRLDYLAFHDALTGLPNRAVLMDRLTHAIAKARRGDRRMALMFVDLDNFKQVNDGLGHAAGDELLRETSRRIGAAVRQEDTVARFGGDEFTVLLEEITDQGQARAVAERILEAVRQSVTVQGREVCIGASIGIALFPEHGEDGETLMKHADATMYRAKEAGRNQIVFYTEEIGARVAAHLALSEQLRQAVEHQQFELHYQPIFELADRRLSAREALLRWNHPERGLLPPGDFLAKLEDTGLIVPAGEQAFAMACRAQARWRAAGSHCPVAVNLSPPQFRSSALPRRLAALVEEAGLQPQDFSLEITETLLMDDTDGVRKAVSDLHELGFALAVDDFGAGYSSLAYLRRFPIDTLKIDRSFVRELPGNGGDAAIVESMIGMAHKLGLRVVAEGVETEAQMRLLREFGCDRVQGFLLGRPEPAGDDA